MSLEENEKYLYIKIVGHEAFRAFLNKTQEGKQPHFKSDGVAVWVATKKPKPKDHLQCLEKEFIDSL
jgi:hypothetical protein